VSPRPRANPEQERYERWLEWLGRIDHDVTQLALDRHVYQRLGEITHAANLPASYLFEAFRFWYVRAQATAIRRQCEVDPQSASLASLLDQMRRFPEVLTRTRYVGLYGAADDWQFHAHAAFDRLAGAGVEKIPVGRIERDVERLADVARPVKGYVDRLVAHWDRRGLSSELHPTFAEMNTAIDAIGEVFMEWSQWLTAVTRAEMVPVFQYDWKAPLRVAWLPALP
jgi:hypothetical protein